MVLFDCIRGVFVVVYGSTGPYYPAKVLATLLATHYPGPEKIMILQRIMMHRTRNIF
jgi:hypothetical protein